jgi:hypothetical protein
MIEIFAKDSSTSLGPFSHFCLRNSSRTRKPSKYTEYSAYAVCLYNATSSLQGPLTGFSFTAVKLTTVQMSELLLEQNVSMLTHHLD